MWRRRSRAAARPRSDTDGVAQGGRADRLPERRLGHDVDGAPEEPLEAELQARQVQEGPPGLEGDEEIHVAIVPLLPARHRAKHANLARAALGGRAADLVAEFGESVAKSHGASNLAARTGGRQRA